MRIMCLSVFNYTGLTIGKVYTVVESFGSKSYYRITDDTGERHWYPKSNFITLDEWRSKQIESVL